jgi:8-oxo-dGTP pyrophosphatase MutT (NUDIX family)
MNRGVLAHSLDSYGGANVDPAQLPHDPLEFHERLQASLHAWGQQGTKGVWLKLPIHLSELVPVAVKHGFTYHSASADSAVLCRWLPPSKSPLPSGPTAQVGAGAYILSTDHKILLVQEACGPTAATGFWKVPTGLLERGEDVATAILREVLEETGLHVSFVGVLGMLRRWCRRPPAPPNSYLANNLLQGRHCHRRIRRHVHHMCLPPGLCVPGRTPRAPARRARRCAQLLAAAARCVMYCRDSALQPPSGCPWTSCSQVERPAQ